MHGAEPVVRLRIRVTGTVQGVGFRPFVYREATRLGLRGWVRNDAAGVLIEAEGPAHAIDEITRLIAEEPPPLARVGSVRTTPIPRAGGDEFSILVSETGDTATVAVSVDTATCEACLAEVDDPNNRRYRYPFTNCTDCGPRYTIVRSVPYDRPATTMAAFTMCTACRSEYDDPSDRRFHAQPNACPDCGPRLRWVEPPVADANVVVGEAAFGSAALESAIGALRSGRIVAIKGIGGFHLAVDAADPDAVGELRRRKHRDDKPFAVMVGDLDAARSLCDLGEPAVEMLTSSRRPIVIAPRRAGAAVAGGVAPDLNELGVMIAYSPLHHLLLSALGRPLVMTSGNLSDEPIAHTDDDAFDRLAPLVDGFLGHDRGIHIRCDDSVVRSIGPVVGPVASPVAGSGAGGRTQILRRARGFAPEPIPLPGRRPDAPAVLAVGAELKSTIAVTVGNDVVASQHIGDLEHLASYRSFLQAIDHLGGLYDVTPEVVARDGHPEYLSSKFADDRCAELGLDAIEVQHHHAHVASCLVEHGRTGPVLGVAFDGLGYGPDGTLWGGEFLVADLGGFERVGHLVPIAMPGGVTAIREPWRMAVAWASRAGIDHGIDDPRHDAVEDLVRRGHGPVTTSMGRLFDAVSALLGLRASVTYEGQAAIVLEAMARRVPRADAPRYDVTIDRDEAGLAVIDPAPLVAALMADRRNGTAVEVVAAGFHESIGRAAARVAVDQAKAFGLQTVALSGGVFQNVRLTEVVEDEVSSAGLEVLTHRTVPPNDGGISIGQAAVAAALPSRS